MCGFILKNICKADAAERHGRRRPPQPLKLLTYCRGRSDKILALTLNLTLCRKGKPPKVWRKVVRQPTVPYSRPSRTHAHFYNF